MNEIYDKILADRESRSKKIEFLKSTFKALITVKSNIPGLSKNIKVSYVIVEYFLKRINPVYIKQKWYVDGYDGPCYIIASDAEPDSLKKEFVNIEENDLLGRFVDIDVYSKSRSLSRGYLRQCYLCGEPAFKCSRENKHSEKEIIAYIEKKVLEYFSNQAVTIIDEAMKLELDLHPKFGLVTPYSNGSHNDMNYSLMIKAKDTILPFFKRMFIIGWSDYPIKEIWSCIRLVGLDAEEKMLESTNGINAYRGLIFNMGILVTVYSYCIYNHYNLDRIPELIKEMTIDLLDDFSIETNTFGYYAYKKYNIKGARGEIMNGIPNVYRALDYLKDLSPKSRMDTLIYLISSIEDTVFLKRCKTIKSYHYTKSLFKQLNSNNTEKINELNDYCINNNLSFGGSADLLVLTIFLKKVLS
jgi:holo-ACP synthase/triphosphoribosyl-dephospho-CoA synthase